MVDCYAGEIRMFSGSWAPEGWVLCQGQLLQINQYQVLYALLSTTYGGDGVNTFAVPDLRSRIPLGFSSSTPPSPLSTYSLGATGGEEQVTLTTANLPVHSHAMLASNANATSTSPTGNIPATVPGTATTGNFYVQTSDPNYTALPMAASSIAANGNGGTHENRMPTIAINFIIATTGVYPTRS